MLPTGAVPQAQGFQTPRTRETKGKPNCPQIGQSPKGLALPGHPQTGGQGRDDRCRETQCAGHDSVCQGHAGGSPRERAGRGWSELSRDILDENANFRLKVARQARLRQHGWQSNQLIDDDPGRSGGGGTEQLGFERTPSAVFGNEVGVILAVDASRLAPNQAGSS